MPKIIAKKEDWIVLGYQLFSKNGIAGIIVEKMAIKLKVNKSSFYWHFKTKTEFVNHIIEYWIGTDTDTIITSIENLTSAKEKFKKLVALSFKKDPYLDFMFFLKRYAQKHKDIQAIIDNIDMQRMHYTKQLIMQLGYTQDEAALKASLFYKHLIGYHEMIRYKKQSKNYTTEVKKELNQFINY